MFHLTKKVGKSSLVAKTAKSIQFKSKKIVFCMIDLNNIRTRINSINYLPQKSFNSLLSMKQINFLNALTNKEEQVTSQSVLKKYNLGTSANVIKTQIERFRSID